MLQLREHGSGDSGLGRRVRNEASTGERAPRDVLEAFVSLVSGVVGCVQYVWLQRPTTRRAREPALKRAPPPYPKDHPRADLLKHKSMTLYRNFGQPAWLHTAKAREQIVVAWRGCGNLNDWLAKQVGPSELPDSRR